MGLSPIRWARERERERERKRKERERERERERKREREPKSPIHSEDGSKSQDRVAAEKGNTKQHTSPHSHPARASPWSACHPFFLTFFYLFNMSFLRERQREREREREREHERGCSERRKKAATKSSLGSLCQGRAAASFDLLPISPADTFGLGRRWPLITLLLLPPFIPEAARHTQADTSSSSGSLSCPARYPCPTEKIGLERDGELRGFCF